MQDEGGGSRDPPPPAPNEQIFPAPFHDEVVGSPESLAGLESFSADRCFSSPGGARGKGSGEKPRQEGGASVAGVEIDSHSELQYLLRQFQGQTGQDADMAGAGGVHDVLPNNMHNTSGKAVAAQAAVPVQDAGSYESVDGIGGIITIPSWGAQYGSLTSQVMLFDPAGSTYLCVLGAGNQIVQEYFRRDGPAEPWSKVERSDKSKSLAHHEAGVPKTIAWTGPTIVVYTNGKLVGKCGVGEDSTVPNRKYYQWCQVCCYASCNNALEGCANARCWVAPRKWKKHIESHTHLMACAMSQRMAQEQIQWYPQVCR